MIGATIIATAQPGKGEELARVWADAGRKTLLHDPECHSFVVALSIENSDLVIASEIYTSKAALDAHNDSDLAKELLPALMPLVDGPPTVYVANVVD